MNFYQGKAYLDFEKKIITEMERKSSFAILSVPGAGVSYFAWKFVQKNKNLSVNHIISHKDELKDFNILDFDFAKNYNALSTANEYFQAAVYPQRFALVINTPWILNRAEYEGSYSAKQIYSYYYFKSATYVYTQEFVKSLNPSLSEKDIKRIHTLSGGILRLAKFFSVNPEFINKNADEVISDADFLRVAKPALDHIEKCGDDMLEKLAVKRSGKYISEILSTYFDGREKASKISIKINPDLTFTENGFVSDESLTKIEKDIIELVLDKGIVKREEISEMKWGKGSYDKFSDQAINKTIQRLNGKLSKYRVKAVPKVGYKIIENSI